MSIPNPETLEQAREMLLQNSNTMAEMQNTIDTLTADLEKQGATLEEVRTLNQKYFLQLSQGRTPDPEPDPEPEETLEEYARTLKGVIV